MAHMRSEYKIEPVKVVWQIKDFEGFLFSSQPNNITSPEITAYLPNPTKWCFKLYVKGENTVKICIKNKSHFKIRINCEIRLPIRDQFRTCYIVVHTFRPEEEIGTPPYNSHFKIDNALLNDIESLYRQHNLADIIISFDDEEFPVHLALLHVRAPKLENFLRNHFEANTFEQFLKVEGITTEGLEVFLRYIYCGHLWKIMAEKCEKFNNLRTFIGADEANIRDLVCNSCYCILRQVFKMSIIFEMVNLRAELNPPVRYELVETSYGSVSRYACYVKFSELTAYGSPPVLRVVKIQHIRLVIKVCLKRDKYHNEVIEFALRLLHPVPETETSLKFYIAVVGLESEIPPLEGTICWKPSKNRKPNKNLIRFLPTFRTKSFPKKNEQLSVLGDLFFVLKLTLPYATKSDNRYESGRLNLPARIYNYISFQENVLSICPSSDDKVVIHIANETIEVSKFILCARSPVFRAMFSTKMIEGITSTVKIPHIDFKTFNYFVKYIQHGKLPRKTKLKWKSIELWLKLLQVADMYFVESLVAKCLVVLRRNLNIGNVFKVIAMARYLNNEDLLDLTWDFILDRFQNSLNL